MYLKHTSPFLDSIYVGVTNCEPPCKNENIFLHHPSVCVKCTTFQQTNRSMGTTDVASCTTLVSKRHDCKAKIWAPCSACFIDDIPENFGRNPQVEVVIEKKYTTLRNKVRKSRKYTQSSTLCIVK